MRTRSLAVAFAVGTALFVTGAAAQHEQHHQDQVSPPAQTAEPPKASEKTSGNMMSQMPQMMMGQHETAKIVDQLVESLAAIESENDPTALKAKLSAHGKLLKGLQSKTQSQSHMMEMMQHMMNGSMMSSAASEDTGNK